MVTTDFEDSQFGFIPGIGTNMAISLAQDVITHNIKYKSAMHWYSLDAEGAFDALPFPVLFRKAYGILPSVCWRIMYLWYSNIAVQIRWKGSLGKHIKAMKGTRQGGLSSPFLFNVFYQGMVNKLSEAVGGSCINGVKYNVFCYADDILLCSTTVTGLQKLINLANRYISYQGLSFNPAKTKCMVFGKCYLDRQPSWVLNRSALDVQCNGGLKYLGATLSAKCGKQHVQDRVAACRRAFYGMRDVGLYAGGLDPYTVAHIWKTALQPVLMYGVQAVHLNRSQLLSMDSAQASLVKTTLGLSKGSRSAPLLQALKINKSLHCCITLKV